READAVRRICRAGGQVIAAGGGTVMDRVSLSLLRRTGPLVWLRADLEELLSRAAAEAERPRPLLTRPRADLQRLYAGRKRIYGLADYVVDVSGKSPDEVADQVERLLTGHERPAPQRVPVRLGGRSYDVHVGSGLLDQVGSLCCQGGAFSKGLLITNETVGSLYGGLVGVGRGGGGLRVPGRAGSAAGRRARGGTVAGRGGGPAGGPGRGGPAAGPGLVFYRPGRRGGGGFGGLRRRQVLARRGPHPGADDAAGASGRRGGRKSRRQPG